MRDFIDSMHSALRRHDQGGGCYGVATAQEMLCEVHSLNELLISELDREIARCLHDHGIHFTIVTEATKEGVLSPEAKAQAETLHRLPQKLTRKMFSQLPLGVFLASNLMRSRTESVFAEYVRGASERENQWQRIKARGCDQRLCYVFPNETEYSAWRSSVP